MAWGGTVSGWAPLLRGDLVGDSSIHMDLPRAKKLGSGTWPHRSQCRARWQLSSPQAGDTPHVG